jgi:hypothetical protein
MATESLVELIFVIAAVSMVLSLLSRGTEWRFVLAFSGIVLAAVGVALLVVIAYPRETLLVLGTGAMVTGIGWGCAHTRWLAPLGTLRWPARIRRSL